jgi:trk system potassium uptake protein TrkH
MINFRIIARFFSLVLIIEGLFMLLAGGISLVFREKVVSSFLYSAIITIVSGILAFGPLKKEERVYGNKEGFIIVTGMWVLLILFGTLPFLISGSIDNFTDALFETASGFTTTGATILTDIEATPKGILFWRSLTQWLGGIGIIFISMSVFPSVRSVNIQLSPIELSGQSTDKIQPRMIDAVKRLFAIYAILTFAEAVMLFAGGMPLFDSVCHSFSTLSTGGFSTSNTGVSAFSTPYIKIVLTIFMFIAGTNMALVYFTIKGNLGKISGNSEFIFYSALCLVFTLISSFFLFHANGFRPGKALLEGTFQVISLITTTGFYTLDYDKWGFALTIIIFILMLTGAMAGSTSGGIKGVRLLLITKNSRQEMKRLIHPNAFIPVRLDKHVVPNTTILYLLIFIILYFISLCIGAFVISLMDYDMITSFSTSASMLANIGPGLGTFGPFSNYSSLPAEGKLFLSFLMLLGRLELITLLLLLTRSFYRH